MKRVLPYSLILSLCLLFSLPVVADAFLGRAKSPAPASELVGIWKLESFANVPKPADEFEFFKDGTAIFKDAQLRKAGMPEGMGVSGTWRVENNRMTVMYGGLGMSAYYAVSGSGSILTITYDKNTNAHAVYFNAALVDQARTELARKEAEAQRAALKGSGFIALSDNLMNWADAKAWCQQQGGRLPRINNSDSLASGAIWDSANNRFVAGIRIDGFGAPGRPWSEVGLPSAFYWTGTEYSDRPGDSWFVDGVGGDSVDVHNHHQGNAFRVVCVP